MIEREREADTRHAQQARTTLRAQIGRIKRGNGETDERKELNESVRRRIRVRFHEPKRKRPVIPVFLGMQIG